MMSDQKIKEALDEIANKDGYYGFYKLMSIEEIMKKYQLDKAEAKALREFAKLRKDIDKRISNL